MVELLQGDCLELLSTIPDHSVDLVLTDPPYGTTANEWDMPIDMAEAWPELWRVCRQAAPVLLFAQLPFLADLVVSAPNTYRYDWVLEKPRATGFLNANKMPLKAHEHILVFYQKNGKFSPQYERGTAYITKRRKREKSSNYRGGYGPGISQSNGDRYPRDLLHKDKWTWGGGHPGTSNTKAGPLARVHDPHLHRPGRYRAGFHHGFRKHRRGRSPAGTEFHRHGARPGLFCHRAKAPGRGPGAERI